MSGGTGNVSAQVSYIHPELVKAGGGVTIGGEKDLDLVKRTFVQERVPIEDGRAAEDSFSLQHNGFVKSIMPLPASRDGAPAAAERVDDVDYEDEDEVRQRLYPCVAELVQRETGREYVFVQSHLLRGEDPVALSERSGAGEFTHVYARYAHTDLGKEYFERSSPHESYVGRPGAPNFILDFIARHPILDDERQHFDLAYVNVWKPHGRPVEQKPLCLLDAQTLDQADIVSTTYTGISELNSALQYARDRRDNKIQLLGASASHRWVYFSRMEPTEALIFKQMDTRPGHAPFCFHTAFEHPHTPAGARGRRSVEFRVVLAFRKENAPKPQPQASL